MLCAAHRSRATGRSLATPARQARAIRPAAAAAARLLRRYSSATTPAQAMACSPARPSAEVPAPGTAASVDFDRLGFAFTETRAMATYRWKDGHWEPAAELHSEPYLNVHAMSAGIHYGQGLFEGAKAHHCADGTVGLWNVRENAQRLNRGCSRLMMPAVPEELFMEGINKVVANNVEYVPPYGSGGALYIRPFMFGTGPQLGLTPAPEYKLVFVVIPVGAYYPLGLQAMDACVLSGYGRAAPGGVGHVKAAGNYGADIRPSIEAKAEGFPISLYLDTVHNRYIEEFNVSNFVGISKDGGTYVTPDSLSVLPSITNLMLQELAVSIGMNVEVRPIAIEECADFAEVAGCGTAVVLAPLSSLKHHDTTYRFEQPAVIKDLYERYRAIQVGEVEDPFGWVEPVDLSAREHMAEDDYDAGAEAGRGGTGEVPIRLLGPHGGLAGCLG